MSASSLVALSTSHVSFSASFPGLVQIPHKDTSLPRDTTSACVVVLGDVGRSPRMQFHALSLAANGWLVDLVGYVDAEPMREILRHPCIRVRSLGRPPSPLRRSNTIRLVLQIAWRAVREQVALLWTLCVRCRSAGVLLTQNPPALPLLPVMILRKAVFGSLIIVDVHNFGDSLLALRFGDRHWFVRLYSLLERLTLRINHAVLCVSEAMQKEILDRLTCLDVRVVYDLPRSFESDADANTHHVRPRLTEIITQRGISPSIPPSVQQDIRRSGPGRPRIAVCPSSWTPDDDFELLINAIGLTDTRLRRSEKHRSTASFESQARLIVIITGEGDLRHAFVERIGSLELQHVLITTGWFSYDDYRRLLVAADLGLCLHHSSSGVDLPMKLADMQEAGLLPCVFDYGDCLRERIVHGVDAVLFRDSEKLSEILHSLVDERHPQHSSITNLTEALRRRPVTETWEKHWAEVVTPLLDQAAGE